MKYIILIDNIFDESKTAVGQPGTLTEIKKQATDPEFVKTYGNVSFVPVTVARERHGISFNGEGKQDEGH